MGGVKDWIKRNPNKVGVLVMLTLGWIRFILNKYTGIQISPETENYVLSVLTVLGVITATRKAKK